MRAEGRRLDRRFDISCLRVSHCWPALDAGGRALVPREGGGPQYSRQFSTAIPTGHSHHPNGIVKSNCPHRHFRKDCERVQLANRAKYDHLRLLLEVGADKAETCTIEAITHAALTKGMLDRCRELKVSEAPQFDVACDGLENAEAREHTFRVTRTWNGRESLNVVCTSVRSLPYQATGNDWEEVPTLKDFDSEVQEFYNGARRAA